jgi:hypothetical protein
MELLKFSTQLGGKDPAGPPYRIPARDLDANFAKLKPLAQDGNNRQYAIDETPDGWFLRLFPEAQELNQGATPVGDAPSDGTTYARKNAAWSSIVVVPPPPSSGVYVLGSQNGALAWLATEACTT